MSEINNNSNALIIAGMPIGSIPITDATIITRIRTLANWNDSGNYTGVTTSLKAGNVYYDSNTNLKYEFDGTTLRRSSYNPMIL